MHTEFFDGTLGAVRNPQRVEIKPSDGTRIGRPEGGWQASQLAALGLYPVAHVDRPADTDTVTHTESVELATPGDPTTATTVWTVRDWTATELADRATAAAAEAARETVRASLALVADGTGLGTDQELRDALQLVAQELTTSGLLP
tara:strand:+ start:1496 stop:1933 length:438 start_codon:yes stop_codon:yes gene_type:complete